MKRFSWMALAAVAALTGACGSGTPNDAGPTDSGTDDIANTDGSSGACTDAGFLVSTADAGNCYRVETCNGMNFCPALVTNDPNHPQFVITRIDIQTPTPLMGSTGVGGILNGAIASGTFFWGIDLNLTTNQITTGSLAQGAMAGLGTGFLESNFSFVTGGAPTGDGGAGDPNRWNAVTAAATVTGDAFSTDTIALITVPVYTPDGMSVLAELPLRNAHMQNVQMNSNRNCVGYGLSRFSSCTFNSWLTKDAMNMPYGTLEADLTVEDARNVQVEQLHTDLCRLIAMPPAGMDCTSPQTGWAHPPDSMINGSTTNNAWHVRAFFSAVASHIAQAQ